jgi:protein TonB
MPAKFAALFCFLALLLQGQVAPRIYRRVEPVYPPLAKAMRIQGTVRLAAVIDEDGAVAALKLICGHPLLVNAAMDAVKHWRYRPAERNGKPVRAVIPVAVRFDLSYHPSEQSTRV